MSLEDAIAKLTAAVEANTAALSVAVDKAAAAPAAPAAEAPKTTKSTKTETKAAEPEAKAADAAPTGPTYESVKAKFQAWLAEHPKDSGETKARQTYLKDTLWPKLGVAKLGDLDGKADELVKVDKWIDGKARTDILGYGAGIFEAPAKAEAEAEDL